MAMDTTAAHPQAAGVCESTDTEAGTAPGVPTKAQDVALLEFAARKPAILQKLRETLEDDRRATAGGEGEGEGEGQGGEATGAAASGLTGGEGGDAGAAAGAGAASGAGASAGASCGSGAASPPCLMAAEGALVSIEAHDNVVTAVNELASLLRRCINTSKEAARAHYGVTERFRESAEEQLEMVGRLLRDLGPFEMFGMVEEAVQDVRAALERGVEPRRLHAEAAVRVREAVEESAATVATALRGCFRCDEWAWAVIPYAAMGLEGLHEMLQMDPGAPGARDKMARVVARSIAAGMRHAGVATSAVRLHRLPADVQRAMAGASIDADIRLGKPLPAGLFPGRMHSVSLVGDAMRWSGTNGCAAIDGDPMTVRVAASGRDTHFGVGIRSGTMEAVMSGREENGTRVDMEYGVAWGTRQQIGNRWDNGNKSLLWARNGEVLKGSRGRTSTKVEARKVAADEDVTIRLELGDGTVKGRLVVVVRGTEHVLEEKLPPGKQAGPYYLCAGNGNGRVDLVRVHSIHVSHDAEVVVDNE